MPLVLCAYAIAAKYVFAVEKVRFPREIDATNKYKACSVAGNDMMLCLAQNVSHIFTPVS